MPTPAEPAYSEGTTEQQQKNEDKKRTNKTATHRTMKRRHKPRNQAVVRKEIS